MNGNTSWMLLLLLGAVLGAFLLLSGPPSVPAATAVSTRANATVVAAQATTSGALLVDAGRDLVVGEREAVRLQGQIAGRSSPASVRWTAAGGLGFFSDPSRLDPIYTTPSACDCCQEVTLTLTVVDRSGGTASDALVLRIRDPIACPSPRGCGEMALAIAPACPPPPCPAPSIESRCPEPDVPCAGPCVTHAPGPATCRQVPVPCRCGEECGPVWDSAWPLASSPLDPAERPTPQIVPHFPARVIEGAAIPLRAIVRNPACTSVCFAWSASQGGFERGDTLEPLYHAPMTSRPGGERVTITFTIHDATGRPSYDQIRIQVVNVP